MKVGDTVDIVEGGCDDCPCVGETGTVLAFDDGYLVVYIPRKNDPIYCEFGNDGSTRRGEDKCCCFRERELKLHVKETIL